MMTAENKESIYTIAKEHFDQFDVLKVLEFDLVKKVRLIYNELPNVYKKLSDAKVLPDGINLDIFMKIVLPHLEDVANEAHTRQLMGYY